MSTTTPTPSAEATPPTDQTTHTCCGRRTVLRAAGLVALTGGAVALGACSADSSTTAPTPSATSSSPSAEASSPAASPSESAAESPSEEATSEAPAGTAVAISEVAVGGGVVVEEKYVVTQPSAGEFKAFSAICTHQGCPVGSVEDGVIICPCHGSQFDISSGDPVGGPAQEPLATVEFTESGDNIVITG